MEKSGLFDIIPLGAAFEGGFENLELAASDSPTGTSNAPKHMAHTDRVDFKRPRTALLGYNPDSLYNTWLTTSAVRRADTDGEYVALFAVPAAEQTSTTITYEYDPLNRLTAADYTSGEYFYYTYDASGNRLSEETPAGTVDSTYDAANRITGVGGVRYTMDNNGNLLSDGSYNYTYSYANRMVTATDGTDSYSYVYNGLGERLQQTDNGVTTSYVVDMKVMYSQVLADGTNTYLYGNGRQGERND